MYEDIDNYKKEEQKQGMEADLMEMCMSLAYAMIVRKLKMSKTFCHSSETIFSLSTIKKRNNLENNEEGNK